VRKKTTHIEQKKKYERSISAFGDYPTVMKRHWWK